MQDVASFSFLSRSRLYIHFISICSDWHFSVLLFPLLGFGIYPWLLPGVHVAFGRIWLATEEGLIAKAQWRFRRRAAADLSGISS